jgi:hypothetical protein
MNVKSSCSSKNGLPLMEFENTQPTMVSYLSDVLTTQPCHLFKFFQLGMICSLQSSNLALALWPMASEN